VRGKFEVVLVNTDLLPRQIQQFSTVRSFIYFSATCFDRSIRLLSGRSTI